MKQIHEALSRLSLDLSEFKESLLWNNVEPQPYLRQLNRTVEALEVKFDSGFSPKPQLDPEEVWAKWRAVHHELEQLSGREIRTLCVSPKTAMRVRLVEALIKSPDALKRLTTLNGFVQAYFAEWRVMENPDLVEKLIQDTVAPGRITRKSRVLDIWRRSLFLFSSQSSQRIAGMMISDRKSAKAVCDEFFIDAASPVAVDALERAAALAVTGLVGKQSGIGPDGALKELKWISTNLLSKTLSAEGYRSALSKLIVSRLPEQSPTFQAALVELVHADERMGDLRLANCAPNWRTVPQGAKDRFLAWLAKETLQFFFDTLVPRNDENRRRANFWLEYAKEQGKIRDFQVAVSDDDRYRILSSRAKTIPAYSRVTGGKTSAFLMVFEGYGTEYVVIEFSETGNAAYIYERKAFESLGTKLRSQSFHLKEDLKRIDDANDRIWHRIDTRERWEVKARRTLAELGIRP